ncbi:uncharacterized protein [Physcomitrium patens]|uniref:PARP catalytic domain-containing protein n=1 Tax=Physcomitrium patens TaxID=3218 RepID=A9TVE2_PHYPA|nr:uncharacterized protein LOC112275710 [Physcomitrium patens]XP_024362077.1 uncharacterized protein LOC112275710 [Physcomitrium patens]XP_024362078.1 uncharacterized protein LOC112275710 [Physcomitrium patens]XP_024362079.1 uncharacterized protein LOC112275710 [Physcomitrium patens]XP_024362080.1 uncharacterized protein LOC112275710 [Physcomitrium patens]PNR29686.1 hypothetical protein PHYPA_028380 [Physcomitrium patens]|eukprot:XP_024362076.1 uncharacterized protein LOC112275710 [Physcomitrella patens]
MACELEIDELEVEYRTWAGDKESVLSELSIRLEKASDTDLTLLIKGEKLQILIPSTYRNLDSSTSTDHESSEVFLLWTEKITSKEVKKSMSALTEKLEKVRVKPKALHQVLDLLLAGMQKLQVMRESMNESSEEFKHEKTRERANSDEEENDDKSYNWHSEDDSKDDDGDIGASYYDIATSDPSTVWATMHEIWEQGFLYAFSEDARKQCEACKAQTLGDLQNPLMWLSVVSKPKVLVVELQFDLVGIIDDRVAAGLGLSINEHVSLSLEFSKNTWSETTLQWTEFECQNITVSQDSKLIEARDTERDEIDRYLESSFGAGHRSYGLDVLFPDLTRKFFAALNHHGSAQTGNYQYMEGIDENLNNKNPFLGLALAISHQLKRLPQCCIICWREHPFSVTRMRTCDSDLCLHLFEELGLGVSVLGEVKSSPELVEMEMAFAAAALRSKRDVFEPFPAFSLQKDELRLRSGWFSNNNMSETASRSKNRIKTAYQMPILGAVEDEKSAVQSNKNTKQLSEALASIPPINVLQKCADERSLKRVLARAWYSHYHEGVERAPHEGSVPPRTSHGAHTDAAPTPLLSPLMKKSRSPRFETEKMEPWRKVANLAYDLMRFILTTNRGSICQVFGEDEVLKVERSPKSKDAPGESGIYQFVVLHDSPERAADFDHRRRDAGGSYFAFHGSSGENWYSILRNGLRSMSYTPFMSCGAAHGAGIYLASDLSTSMKYAKYPSYSWRHGMLKHGFQCVAICEVVKGSISRQKIISTQFTREANVFVVSRECDVAIRYLLVFKSPATSYVEGVSSFRTNGSMLNENLNLYAHYERLLKYNKDAVVSQQHTRMLARCKTLSVVVAECEGHNPDSATPPPPPSSSSSSADRHPKRVRLAKGFDAAETTDTPPLESKIVKSEPTLLLTETTASSEFLYQNYFSEPLHSYSPRALT